MRFIPLILLYLIGSFITITCAEAQTIRGQIIDHITGQPIPGANIRLLSDTSQTGTVSDKYGNFKIENISSGRHSILVSYIGFKKQLFQNILVSSAKETFLKIELKEEIISTDEVVIEGNKGRENTINRMALVSARSFTVEETERYAGSIGDPARMAANFAGVSTINDQRNDIVIRGNSPRGVLWRLEGVDIPNPNHFSAFGNRGGPISILNNNLLSNSDFFTGAFPAEYGNALSGIFDLHLRPGNNTKREHVLQAGMYGFELGTEGPAGNNRSSYLANYRYSTTAVIDAMGLELGTDGVPQYQDLSFNIKLPIKTIGKISLFGIGGYSFVDEFDSEKPRTKWSNPDVGENFTFTTGMGATGLSFLYFLTNKTSVIFRTAYTTSLSAVSKDTFLVNEQPIPQYRQKANENTWQSSLIFRSRINSKNNLKSGITYEKIFFNFSDSIAIPDNDFLIRINKTGVYDLIRNYLQWHHQLSNTAEMNTGVHSLWFPYTGEITAEPRASIRFNFVNGHSFNLGTGLHSQLPPRIFYLTETELPNGSKTLSNPDLKFTKSLHTVIGYNYMITKNIRARLEVYGQYLFNVPVRETEPTYSMLNYGSDFSSRVILIDSLENTGTGRNYGLEFTFERFLHKGWYCLITGSLYESKYKGADEILRNTAFNGNFALNFLTGREFPIKQKHFLNFDLAVVYAGSNRYIPYTVQQSSSGLYYKEFRYQEAYSLREKNYFRINIRIGYKMNLKRVSYELAVDIHNLTNRKNIFYKDLNPQTGNLKTIYQFPLLPLATLRMHF